MSFGIILLPFGLWVFGPGPGWTTPIRVFGGHQLALLSLGQFTRVLSFKWACMRHRDTYLEPTPARQRPKAAKRQKQKHPAPRSARPRPRMRPRKLHAKGSGESSEVGTGTDRALSFPAGLQSLPGESLAMCWSLSGGCQGQRKRISQKPFSPKGALCQGIERKDLAGCALRQSYHEPDRA